MHFFQAPLSKASVDDRQPSQQRIVRGECPVDRQFEEGLGGGAEVPPREVPSLSSARYRLSLSQVAGSAVDRLEVD
jgi:hypothetical protein